MIRAYIIRLHFNEATRKSRTYMVTVHVVLVHRNIVIYIHASGRFLFPSPLPFLIFEELSTCSALMKINPHISPDLTCERLSATSMNLKVFSYLSANYTQVSSSLYSVRLNHYYSTLTVY